MSEYPSLPEQGKNMATTAFKMYGVCGEGEEYIPPPKKFKRRDRKSVIHVLVRRKRKVGVRLVVVS